MIEGSTAAPPRLPLKLGLLFGALYFVQGFGDPTGGLMAQPVMSLLKSWQWDADRISAFMALFWLPWSLKPLYGVLTDFVPLRALHRKSYLVLLSGATTLGLLALTLLDAGPEDERLFFWLLMIPTIGFAFTDVVVDAFMIETGQPLGLTGKIQSVQWTCLYAAGVVAGFAGGYCSEHHIQSAGFMICGLMTLVTFGMSVFWVREAPDPGKARGLKAGLAGFKEALREPVVLGVGAFLFLWSFNPFNSTVLYLHATQQLGITEEAYGTSVSVQSIASMIAAGGYAFICRRISFEKLVHLSIILGILCSGVYGFLDGPGSLMTVSFIYGWVYMTSNLIQLDLAARIIPARLAGTIFALLMSLCNQAVTWSGVLGGQFYTRWSSQYGVSTAFRMLVLTGCFFTALCWLVVPLLFRHLRNGGSDDRKGGWRGP